MKAIGNMAFVSYVQNVIVKTQLQIYFKLVFNFLYACVSMAFNKIFLVKFLDLKLSFVLNSFENMITANNGYLLKYNTNEFNQKSNKSVGILRNRSLHIHFCI